MKKTERLTAEVQERRKLCDLRFVHDQFLQVFLKQYYFIDIFTCES